MNEVAEKLTLEHGIEIQDYEPVEDLPTPVGWTLLIQPMKVKAQTDGGIVLPTQVKEAEEYLEYTGKVVSMGQLCYRHDKFRPHPDAEPIRLCEVGDYVVHGQYGGKVVNIKTKDGITRYRLIHDDEIKAVTKKPESLIAYI